MHRICLNRLGSALTIGAPALGPVASRALVKESFIGLLRVPKVNGSAALLQAAPQAR